MSRVCVRVCGLAQSMTCGGFHQWISLEFECGFPKRSFGENAALGALKPFDAVHVKQASPTKRPKYVEVQAAKHVIVAG